MKWNMGIVRTVTGVRPSARELKQTPWRRKSGVRKPTLKRACTHPARIRKLLRVPFARCGQCRQHPTLHLNRQRAEETIRVSREAIGKRAQGRR